MNPNASLLGLSLSTALSLALPSQDSQPPRIDPAALRVPVHTTPRSDGLGTAVWAAGPDYKVSFHDGMTFYPVLGTGSPHNRPVRWRTRSVAVGSTSILGAALASTAHGAWHFEYRYGEVTERYDVRADGVEQTFVLQRRPAAAGDLVVRGEFETALIAAPVAASHAGVVLCDATGAPMVRYGAATAIDAADRRLPLATTFAGSGIEIRVPAGWLADAAFPVVVDPLLSTVFLAQGTGVARDVEIARDDLGNQRMVVFSRAVSASDLDGFAVLMRDDFTGQTVVWSSLETTTDAVELDVAHVSSPGKWLVVFQQDLSLATVRQQTIRDHLHDRNDFGFSATTGGLTSNLEFSTSPSVGGVAASTGNGALVAYQVDRGGFRVNTPETEIFGVILDCRTNVPGTRFAIGEHIDGFDNERPWVTEHRAGGNDPWLVTFQDVRTLVAGDDWDLLVRRVHPDGSNEIKVVGNFAQTAKHKRGAVVTGSGGRFMIAYTETANTGFESGVSGPELFVQRIDWPLGQTEPTRGPIVRLRTGTDLVAGGIADDNVMRSMWAVVSMETTRGDVFADRVGSNSRAAESALVATNVAAGGPPSIAFDDDNLQFGIVHAAAGAVLGNELVYPATALPAEYGTACGPAVLSGSTSHRLRAYAGNENFEVRLGSAPANTFAVLLVGTASSAAPLDALGMTGCVLNVDTSALLFSLPLQLAGTSATIVLPLPAPLAGTLFFQAAYQNPGANRLGVEATRGLRVEVR